MTYYNENDPKMAAWLRELIAEGHIPGGHVDERSIVDVRPNELTNFSQQHFFAGVGGWAYALRLAGWSEDFPVRTGSCPCQPFSQSGKQRGEADERHLWPNLRDLIAFGEPAITFGEQVASPLGREWLARVRADLENLGYEVGAADLCAAGVVAPHIRQRLYWMAHAQRIGRGSRKASKPGQEVWPALSDDGSNASGMANTRHAPRRTSCKPGQENQDSSDARSGFKIGRMADTDGGKPGNGGIQCGWQHGQQQENGSIAGRMEHPAGDRREQRRTESSERGAESRCGLDGLVLTNSSGRDARQSSGETARHGDSIESASSWSNFEIAHCSDGKARRFEPGSFPLAHGVSNRVGLLRGYGNAIVPQVAAEFIRASIEALNNSTSVPAPVLDDQNTP